MSTYTADCTVNFDETNIDFNLSSSIPWRNVEWGQWQSSQMVWASSKQLFWWFQGEMSSCLPSSFLKETHLEESSLNLPTQPRIIPIYCPRKCTAWLNKSHLKWLQVWKPYIIHGDNKPFYLLNDELGIYTQSNFVVSTQKIVTQL